MIMTEAARVIRFCTMLNDGLTMTRIDRTDEYRRVATRDQYAWGYGNEPSRPRRIQGLPRMLERIS